MDEQEQAQTTAFFLDIFRESEGWFCYAWPEGWFFDHRYVAFPDDLQNGMDQIARVAPHRDVFFCAHLLKDVSYRRLRDGKGPRVKENATDLIRTAWADLDECKPTETRTVPDYAVETSPNRFQAYWILDDPIPAAELELLNHKIIVEAKEHARDQSGWALTKLLRVPNTPNHKCSHVERLGYKPIVRLVTP